ncbi:MAG: cytochrome c biogenesis protein CcsA [Thermaerobacter sp.]|nr:cytochrome c biogenesis protein CcsA [Thermaerobacter sp.]
MEARMTTLGAWLMGATLVAYALAAVFHIRELYLPRSRRLAVGTTLAALVLETAVIVERFRSPHAAFLSLYEWMLVLTWLLVAVYLVGGVRSRALRRAGVFLMPIVFFFLLPAAILPRVAAAQRPSLSGWWVWLHLTTATAATGVLIMQAVTALMYMHLERGIRYRMFHAFYRRLPPLEVLDRLCGGLAGVGLGLMTVAIGAGVVWAGHSWHHYWSWNPKESWTALTWLLYTGYVAARRYLPGRRTVPLALFAFGALVIDVLLINLLPGPHSFRA